MSSLLPIMHYRYFHYYIVVTHYYHYFHYYMLPTRQLAEVAARLLEPVQWLVVKLNKWSLWPWIWKAMEWLNSNAEGSSFIQIYGFAVYPAISNWSCFMHTIFSAASDWNLKRSTHKEFYISSMSLPTRTRHTYYYNMSWNEPLRKN